MTTGEIPKPTGQDPNIRPFYENFQQGGGPAPEFGLPVDTSKDGDPITDHIYRKPTDQIAPANPPRLLRGQPPIYLVNEQILTSEIPTLEPDTEISEEVQPVQTPQTEPEPTTVEIPVQPPKPPQIITMGPDMRNIANSYIRTAESSSANPQP